MCDTVQVTFDANNGTGAVSGQTLFCGVQQELRANTFTNEGYLFAGWATNATDRAVYSDRQGVTPDANLTLFAKWTVAPVSMVMFDANGGTGGWSRVMSCGSVLTAPIVARSGYVFVGWSPSVSTTVPDTNVTYVAQWDPASFFVTFNAS